MPKRHRVISCVEDKSFFKNEICLKISHGLKVGDTPNTQINLAFSNRLTYLSMSGCKMWQYRQQSLPCVKKHCICSVQILYPSPRTCIAFANSLLLELFNFFTNSLKWIRYLTLMAITNSKVTIRLTMCVSEESRSTSVWKYNLQNRSRRKADFKTGYYGLQNIGTRFK